MKKCPFCAEDIQEEAIKCRHCSEVLIQTEIDREKFKELKGQENNLAMLCHLITLSGVVIPFGNILGPLILWLVKKDDYELVDDQGKESLNFQISVLLYSMVGFILTFIVIGALFLVVLALFALVQVIKAAIEANKGIKYRYPLNLRLIK